MTEYGPTHRDPHVQLAFRGRSRAGAVTPCQFIRPEDGFGNVEYDSVRLDLRPGGTRDQLIEALLCHFTALRFTRALAGWTLKSYAQRIGQSSSNVCQWRKGHRPLNLGDLSFAIDFLGTGVMPVPSEVDEMLERAREELDTQAGALRPERAVRQLVREQVFGLLTMGYVPPVVVHEAYDAEELVALDALPDVAEAPLALAADVLRRRLFTTEAPDAAFAADGPAPSDPTVGHSDIDVTTETVELDVYVGLDRPRYVDFGQVSGTLGPSWADVRVNLTTSWLTDVHAPGHALLDGWFVVHVEDRADTNRPSRVVVVDAKPEVWQYSPEDIPDDPDWVFTLRLADVAWNGDHPTVTVDNSLTYPTVAWLLHPQLRPNSK